MKNHYYFLFSIICILFSISVNAQPGNLDSDFDSDGKLTVDFDSQNDRASAVAVQPDGKVIVAGYARIAGDDDFAMARFNTDGTYDATFGTGGKVTTSFSANDDVALAMLLQPDGKIILAGNVYNGTYDFAMARYTSTGALDNTFSDDGILYTDFTNSADVCAAAALQPDGKIIAAGLTWDDGINSYSYFALARYNADGSLDNTFSVDGKATTVIGDGALANALVLQPNGYIVAAGFTRITSNYYMALARYKTDGTLDTGFDGDGKVITDNIPFTGHARAVVLQTDGKLIAAGLYETNVLQSFGLVRLNQDGSPDNTFGTGGAVYTSFDNNDASAYAAAIQPDLKIVLAGNMHNGVNFDFAVVRYLSGLNLGTLEFSPSTSALIYPNPLNETTVLSFELATNEVLSISIYDMQGKQIKTLSENQFYAAGKHELSIDAASLATGQYILELENGKGKTVIRLQK